VTAQSLADDREQLKTFFANLFKKTPPPTNLSSASNEDETDLEVRQDYDPIEGPSHRYSEEPKRQVDALQGLHHVQDQLEPEVDVRQGPHHVQEEVEPEVDVLQGPSELLIDADTADDTPIKTETSGPQIDNPLMTDLELSLPTISRRRRRTSVEIWGSNPTRVSPRANKGRKKYDPDFVYY
jgi:hypothetical protein